MKDNVDLICNIGELAGLFERANTLGSFLQTAVNAVAFHMRSAVCSVYLYEEENDELVLTANQGLRTDLIGKVRLKLGEGIIGMALKELRPIRVGRASESPFYRYVPGLDEERYQAFLAVPIVRGLNRVGVLAVQDPVADYFDENDTKALLAIAAQLASVIENAKLLMALDRTGAAAKAAKEPEASKTEALKFVRGIAGSPGAAVGRALVFGMLSEADGVAEDGTAFTAADFQRAVLNTERQLEQLQIEMNEKAGDVASLIFSAHILMVKDPNFTGSIEELIQGGTEPVAAIRKVVGDYSRLFMSSGNPRLREKVQDVRDIGRRIISNLRAKTEKETNYDGRVIVATDVLPSDILRIAAQRAEGLVLISGGATAHIAILARSLQLPLVIVDRRELLSLGENDRIVIDGDQGTLYLNPGEDVEASVVALMQSAREAAAQAETLPAETRTLDGERIYILANINMVSETRVARQFHAAGIGLYRSEFPFIVRIDFPSEEEQFLIYRKLISDMDGAEITFRTLDIGGDKMLSYFPTVNEANPFLGLRAIRFTLKHRDIFERQLRAMLRAGEGTKLRIMFPLISSVDDFQDAKAVVYDCLKQLAAEGVPHNKEPQLGVMVELPSAVEVIDELAEEADFLSIGGNDLVQYMLAVDRTNESISDMYVSHHPAVLRALKRVAYAARFHGKSLSFCGEMASDPGIVPFLLGIGIKRLSVDSRQIPRVHQMISKISFRDARLLAERVLTLGRVKDVAAALNIG